MATSVRLLRRYVWLVDTIRRAGNISLDDINSKWRDNYTLNLNHEDEIPERTFHRHREAIAELFDVEIACDRTTNTYYITNPTELDRPSFSNWIFNGLALDNSLMVNEGVKKRIMFEDTPGGMVHIPVIVEAMSSNRVLYMTYRSYNNSEATHWLIEPRGLKQYRRRWYLIANRLYKDTQTTFALDRIVDLQIAEKFFEPDDGKCLHRLFEEVVGVFVDPDLEVEDVVVRVYGKQRRYFEGVPLHHSQKTINVTPDYSDYHFHLRPEYEFQHELLRLAEAAEVLSPQWLRDDMQWYANQILARYQS